MLRDLYQASGQRSWTRGLFFLALLSLLSGCWSQTKLRHSVPKPDGKTVLQISEALRAVKIPQTRHWRIIHLKPIPANALLFITDEGVPVLADTPWTPEATKILLAWIKRRFGRLPGLATASHYHHDAAGGLATLKAAGVPLAISQKTLELLQEKGEGLKKTLVRQHGKMFSSWKAPQGITGFAPKKGYHTTIGGTEVQVLYFGGAHSQDDVVTWFPKSRLLFAGCLSKGGQTLGYLGDADLKSYPKVVSALQKLKPKIVVPGHGNRLDVGQLQNTLELLKRRR